MATILNPNIFKIRKESSKPIDWLLNKIYKLSFEKWFYQMKAAKHFDELILQRIMLYKFKTLLPNHNAIYYDKNIRNRNIKNAQSKPDFILWKNDYSEWYVIEVELSNHEIRHIDTQLKNFYEGDYSDAKSISKYVEQKFSGHFDTTSFENMIINHQPKIMLIADRIQSEWYNEFEKYSCKFATLQIYVDESENFIYRIGGEFPQEYSSFSYCNLDKRLRALEIDNGSFLLNAGHTEGDIIKLFYRFEFDEWKFMKYGEKYYLEYIGDYLSLDLTIKRYKLILNDKNQIHIIK